MYNAKYISVTVYWSVDKSEQKDKILGKFLSNSNKIDYTDTFILNYIHVAMGVSNMIKECPKILTFEFVFLFRWSV